jgi:hypothetical protein
MAKALREAPGDLWPTGGLGGGKRAAHVEVHHLRNLLIACLGAELVQDAPKVVAAYAPLKARMRYVGATGMDLLTNTWRERPELHVLGALLPKSGAITFGDTIDRLIEAHTDAQKSIELRGMNMRIEIRRETTSALIVLDDGPLPPIRSGKARLSPASNQELAHFSGDISAVIVSRRNIRAAAYLRAGVDAKIGAELAALIADTRWRKQQ